MKFTYKVQYYVTSYGTGRIIHYRKTGFVHAKTLSEAMAKAAEKFGSEIISVE